MEPEILPNGKKKKRGQLTCDMRCVGGRPIVSRADSLREPVSLEKSGSASRMPPSKVSCDEIGQYFKPTWEDKTYLTTGGIPPENILRLFFLIHLIPLPIVISRHKKAIEIHWRSRRWGSFYRGLVRKMLLGRRAIQWSN